MIDIHSLAALLPPGSSVTIADGFDSVVAAGGTIECSDGRRGKPETFEGAHVTLNGVRFSAGRYRPLTRADLEALLARVA